MSYLVHSTCLLQNTLEDLRKMRDDFLSGWHEEYPHHYCEYLNRLRSMQTRIREFQEDGDYQHYMKYSCRIDDSDDDSPHLETLNHNLLYSLLKRSYMKKYDWRQKNRKTWYDEVIWPAVTSAITDIENVLQVQADTMG
jgi:hypothetical protein